MRFEFKKEIGEKIDEVIKALEKEGFIVFNKGREIYTDEQAIERVGDRTPILVRKFSARIEFAIPDDKIEVVK